MYEITPDDIKLARTKAKVFWRHIRRPYVDLPTLQSDAYLGLVKAAKDYKPELGVPFAIYAGVRIAGELRDGLRTRNHSRPNDSRYAAMNAVKFVSFERQVDPLSNCWSESSGRTEERVFQVDEDPELDKQEMVEFLLSRLSSRSRGIVERYYLNGESATEIAPDYNRSPAAILYTVRQAKKAMQDAVGI